MDDATGAVMSPDPEMIQVGDAVWQRPQWRGLVQGAVRAVEGALSKSFSYSRSTIIRWRWFQIVPGPAAHAGSCQSTAPYRIHSRCLNGGADDPDPGRLEHGIERLREAGVPVMQDELRRAPASSRSMSRFRICWTTQDWTGCPWRLDPDAPVAVLDDRKDVDLRAMSRSAVKKSSDRIPCAWDRRNSAQPGPSRRAPGRSRRP